ncbi:LytR/AlgR family response regulator transcription factor [Chryseosolibacter indicus]|uniref:Response regulator n=1 Tax=Chryseosolibacter indicus TaxID=2782351 RepID=A0ABS5VXE7_9BACT|nr:response regulator [Chryseosolibacter indicus]MBT1706093.1 response regulator [Chryseosolibacter indicus]
MSIVNALIVDDEKLDRELLGNLINQYCSSITVLDQASSVDNAIQSINKFTPDVVFLDIHMPTANGFKLLDSFPDREFLIVFTTGHDDYGIQAIKAGAFDYLLKPIDVDELLATEQKILKVLEKKRKVFIPHVKVFHQGEHVLIKADEIVCVEAQGSYVKIFRIGGEHVVVPKNLKQLMALMKVDFLKRVHRSFIINTNHVIRYQTTGNELIVFLAGNVEAKVSRQYKQVLKDLLI